MKPIEPSKSGAGLLAALLVLTALIGIAGLFYRQSVTTAARKVATDNLAAVAESKVRKIGNWRAERLGDANVLMEGVDYRGVPVLAHARAVPDTKWLLVAKVDQAEVNAPLHQRTLQIAVSVGLLILVFSLVAVLLWLQQRVRFYREKEAAVRDSEARYRALFEGSADGIGIADVETRKFKHANPTLCRMLGYTEEELYHMNAADIHPPESLPHVVAEFEAVTRGSKTLAMNLPCLRKDGSIFHADVHAAQIAVDGRPCAMGIFRDITERKQAEAVLARLAAIVEFSDDAIIGKDLNGIITSWNRGAEKLFGYASGEMLGSPIMRLIPADKQDEERQILETIKRGEPVEPFETVRQARDKRLIDVSVMASPIKDATGQVIGVSKVARDITRRKRAEEALRRFQFASDHAADTIFWLDQNAGFYYVNDEACRSLGYTREELMRLSLFDIDPFFPRGKWEENWKRFRDKQTETIRFESRQRRKDGSVFPIEVIVKYSCFGSTELHLAFVRDMTEHKLAEEALRRFQLSSDNAADAIFWVDQNAGFYYVNDAACRSLGYPREELMRLNLFDIDPFISREQLEANWQRSRDEKLDALRMESRHRRKDGSSFPIEVMAKHFDFNGTDLTLAFVRDMTEHKRTEADLAYERDLLRTLLDHSPDDIYFKDAQSRFIKASKAMTRRFGVASPDVMAGKTDFDFFLEEHARPAFEDEQEVIRTGVPIVGKVEKEVWQDGRETWCLTTKMPFRNKDGQIVGTFGVSKDITALKQIEHALAYERDLFKTLMDQSPDSIYFKDLQSRFMRFSQSKVKKGLAAELARHSAAHPNEGLPAHLASEERFAEYLVGKTDFDLFTEAHARPAFEDEQEIIRTGVPLVAKVEREVWLDGHETWVRTSKMPFRDKDGRIVGTFGISEDITAMKQAEAEREHLIQELQRALASVKLLSGLLPICASCKKIRDDKGYWSQVEKYVGEHSEATFTHSLCPDCIKKYFPGLDDEPPA